MLLQHIVKQFEVFQHAKLVLGERGRGDGRGERGEGEGRGERGEGRGERGEGRGERGEGEKFMPAWQSRGVGD